jgi:hypothetical protein
VGYNFFFVCFFFFFFFHFWGVGWGRGCLSVVDYLVFVASLVMLHSCRMHTWPDVALKSFLLLRTNVSCIDNTLVKVIVGEIVFTSLDWS